MPFNDNKFGLIFPTRDGEATGTANERQMLDAIGGAAGFRTRIQKNADGSETILRTRNGAPHFYTNRANEEETAEELSAYMETGELTWTFPAPNSPYQFNSAAWRFNDVQLNQQWLGAISLDDATLGNQKPVQPTPADTGVLRDNIDSLAIGYPRKYYPDGTINPSSDETSKESYGSSTVLKKLVCGTFPPEMFSGKLRLFMQAQYGAAEKELPLNFSIEVLGEAALLYYQPVEIEGAPRIQFYFWAHATTGLFTTADRNYYLLQITKSNTANSIDVGGYPIKLSSAGKKLRAAILDGRITGENITKAEGYMFSDAVIETNKHFYAGTVSVGACGEGYGSTLAYGWHFNNAGTEAAIVRVGSVGDSASNNLDGRARETKLSISRSELSDGYEEGKWAVARTYDSDELNWLDGWGDYNIFAPKSETSAELAAFSYRMSWGTVAEYAFSDVPVYGYYDKLNNWTTVRLNKTLWDGSPRWEQRASGAEIVPSVLANYSVTSSYPSSHHFKESACRKSNNEAIIELHHVTYWTRMAVTVGAWSFSGERKTGNGESWEVRFRGGSSTQWVSQLVVPWQYGPAFSFVSKPQEYQDWEDRKAAAPYGWDTLEYDRYYEVQRLPVRLWNRTTTFDDGARFTLVVPCGDSDAVHVHTNTYRSMYMTGGYYCDTDSWGAHTDYTHFYDSVPNTSANWHLEQGDMPWCWVGFQCENALTWTPATEEVPAIQEIKVHAWSRTLTGQEGTPSGSYASLFTVSRDWPFFNGTIRFKESSGGRYHGTEGFNSGGVLKNSLFVGWY